MWKLIALFVTIVVAVHGQTTPVISCVSNSGDLPINTYIRGCAAPPCVLPQLEDVIIDIVFRAPKTMSSMRTLATAYMTMFGITVPIPYDLEDDSRTCNFLTNTYCPVINGEIVQYTLNMFIQEIFPVGTSVAIEFRVVDESDQTPVFCLRTDVRIAPPRS